jgi:hypothetical protein
VYEDSSTGTPGAPERSVYVLGYSGVLESNVAGMSYDPAVGGTLFRWGNYDYVTSQARWSAAEVPPGTGVPSSQILPASLFLFGRPAWWGTVTWPAIGPDVSGGADPAGHAHKIPAQLCYESSARDADGLLTFNAQSCYPAPAR